MSKVILPPPPPKPPVKKDLWFEIPTTINLEGQEGQYIIEDGPGLVEEDSNEFGLTQRDCVFLQWDIENEIAKFDEEHGFDGTGYHEKDGSYVYSLDKVNTLNQKRQNKISSQEVVEGVEF